MKIGLKTKLFLIMLSVAFGYLICILLINFTMLEKLFVTKQSIIMENELSHIKNSLDYNNIDSLTDYISYEMKHTTFSYLINIETNEVIYNSVFSSFSGSNEMLMEHYNLYKNDYNGELEVSKVFLKELDADVLQCFTIAEISGTECFICVMSSCSGIYANINYFSMFNIFLCFLILIALSIAVYFAARYISKPVIAINEETKRMTKFDFSKKTNINYNDEIGELARNVNKLSDTMKSTLDKLVSLNAIQAKDIDAKTKIDNARKYFISSVSHELKTPISLIMGYAEAIKFKDKNAPVDYYCDIIIDESEKMSKLVAKILQLSQLESKIIPLDLQEFSIKEFVEDYVKHFNLIIKKKKVKVKIYCENDYLVRADKELIGEVISNYLSNALNHIDDKKELKVYVVSNNNKVRISVFNTGKHIHEENIIRLWDSFFKEDKARTREYGGNGLGLSIVKNIMDNHSCDYGVANVEGGVSFYFELDKVEKQLDKK